ncbi:MAG: pyridoxamine 5'-phosphate oxidase family protein [Acidimicrobiia bacterium]|nr:pyridoxamine 5'-phosphate oxidase family protein [Acidimicrobiia bacterium]
MTASSARSEIRRLPDRGSYDPAVINAIFDEALICHVGFLDEGGRPVVIPTIHARIGETLYLHGSPASRMLRTLAAGSQVSVTATLVDAIVLAKSHFHHSMNYRSAVVFGTARAVTDADEKTAAFRAIVDHLVAGRWEGARRPNEKESKATAVVAIDIEEASAKQRTGPPVDDAEDMALPHWAGLIPVALERGQLEPVDQTPLPDHVRNWSPAGS